ncbi:MAG: sigma-54-dependent Fis family transcriptional regulator [Bdellovibrionales bacterium]|nr:sigma-54-dependent Fis family transcriptional regulator [Bdellovibrionales bacterium]
MERKAKILALDDDRNWLHQVPLILGSQYEIITKASIDSGIREIEENLFDVILLDINFENDPRSGLDVFRLIKAKDTGADAIVISGETNPQKLIQIMNAGITSFLPKMCTPTEIRDAVSNAISAKKMKLRAHDLNSKSMSQLIGRSEKMRLLREEINIAVSSGIKDILLVGETGTGKEVVARSIAYLADPNKRFTPVHCGAINDGLSESELFGHVKGAFTGADKDRPSVFEVVGGGYVFLDEIGEMPLMQQTKLLRVLQERQVQRVGSSEVKDVSFRSISATNVNLKEAIADKSFREDLFYRVNKMIIQVPALRDRLEDIPDLVHFFLSDCFPARNIEITEEAIDLLKAYHWPGNVRQLKSTIEAIGSRLKVDIIREGDICRALPEVTKVFGAKATRILVGHYGASIISKERDRFEKAILKAKGNKKLAAEDLGVSRATFYRRATELGLIQGREIESVKYS